MSYVVPRTNPTRGRKPRTSSYVVPRTNPITLRPGERVRLARQQDPIEVLEEVEGNAGATSVLEEFIALFG